MSKNPRDRAIIGNDTDDNSPVSEGDEKSPKEVQQLMKTYLLTHPKKVNVGVAS